MLRALETGPLGPVVVIGLTWTNLDRLAAGEPIGTRTDDLGVRRPFYLSIFGGGDPQAITAELARHRIAAPPGATQGGDGGLIAFDAAVRHGPLAIRVCVLGIPAVTDQALRNGRELHWQMRDGLGLRLLAAQDTDRLAATVTAGKLVLQRVDLREGRTD